MKNLILWVLFVFLAVACSGDNKQQFVGTWVDSYDLGVLGMQSTDLSLYEDNSCRLKLFGLEQTGTWSVEDKTLILKLRDQNSSEDGTYSISKFSIVRINDKELFLKKPGTNDVTEYYKK